MTDNLKERLRNTDGQWTAHYCKPHQIQELRDEAAAEIEHWQTEDANSVSLIQHLSVEIDQLTLENDRLKGEIESWKALVQQYERSNNS
jgi:hypothetical protein